MGKPKITVNAGDINNITDAERNSVRILSSYAEFEFLFHSLLDLESAQKILKKIRSVVGELGPLSVGLQQASKDAKNNITGSSIELASLEIEKGLRTIKRAIDVWNKKVVGYRKYTEDLRSKEKLKRFLKKNEKIGPRSLNKALNEALYLISLEYEGHPAAVYDLLKKRPDLMPRTLPKPFNQDLIGKRIKRHRDSIQN
jgi:hypothetical protein